MEVDPSPVPPPQEYSDCPSITYQSESSNNFDYLQGLNTDCGTMDATSNAQRGDSQEQRHFGVISKCGEVDYSKAVDRPMNINERFIGALDQLDARVEKFRKDALILQEKRDFLNMSVELIKSNDLIHNLTESEREEISCYIQRVNSRLSTVEVNVRTIRDNSQEESLSQINKFIDMMITLRDPVLSRQRCQMYLNACCSADGEIYTCNEGVDTAAASTSMDCNVDMDIRDSQNKQIDKKFESVLLGCTLDDQKTIKRRLHALMNYLNHQIIHQ